MWSSKNHPRGYFVSATFPQLTLENLPFRLGGGLAVHAEHGHRHVARVAIEDDETNGLVEFRVPRRGAGQLAELAVGHHLAR